MTTTKPHEGLEYLTPDELAECVDGLSSETRASLWVTLEELEREGKQAPTGGDHHDPHGLEGPPTVEDPYSYRDVVSSGRGNVPSIWHRLTELERLEINRAMQARDAAYAELEAKWDAERAR